MIRLNLGFIRSSSLPSAVGICAGDISNVAMFVNMAQERLLHDPMAPNEGYVGGYATMVFNMAVSNRHGYIVAPHDIARLIVMDVCGKPIQIKNGFYEFLQFTNGLHPKQTSCLGNGTLGQACGLLTPSQAYERDAVVTLYEQTVSPATLRFYPTSNADIARRILVQGTDQNGQTIYGVDPVTQAAILGEYVTLNLPYVDTVNQFSKITGFLKDQTVGQVQIFQVDGSGNQTLISSMEPNEPTAQYRRYLVNNVPERCCNTNTGTVQIVAQAKFDYVPVQSDSDYTIIQSLPALIEECQSLRYSMMDSANAPMLEAKHHAKAMQLLFGQLDHYLGKTNTAINVPIFGSDRVRLQPL